MTEPSPRLYLIAPADGRLPAPAALKAALEAGDVACVLFPEADDADLGASIEAVQSRGAAALVRNDVALCMNVAADGVHVDGTDRLGGALRKLQPGRIVGCGGFGTRDEAMTAGEQGVDYVMFDGFGTAAGPASFDDRLERVAWWAEIFQVPCVGLAHDLAEVAPLAAAGADFVALADAVWRHAEGPAEAVRQAMAALREGHAAFLSEQAERV